MLIFVVVAMVVLLGFAALAIDVGRAYYTQRALQASADAAALAGAQSLPDPDASIAVATSYSGSDGDKNAAKGVTGVAVNVSTRCLTSAPGCDPVNAVVVKESVTVPTLFAKVLGFDSFDISVKSTACSPCAAKPLDIMLVLDRTGSMCMDPARKHFLPPDNHDSSCADLNNAKAGIKTFLGFLDPSIDHVGFAVFPPALSSSSGCALPTQGNDFFGYDSDTSAYVIVPLSDDYLQDGALNSSSQLVSTVNCLKGAGGTAYATALEKAQAELEANGRPDVQHLIVFMSDGGANVGPAYYGSGSPYVKQPCEQSVSSAASIKAAGTLIYTIGYDLEGAGAAGNICEADSLPNHSPKSPELPAMFGTDALQQMASSPDTFYSKPDTGQLKTIFTHIAADISRPNSRLVDNNKA